MTKTASIRSVLVLTVAALVATTFIAAPALADGIPGYKEEINPPESTPPEPIPYRKVEPRVAVPTALVYPPTVVETPVIVAPPVVVRRPVFIEPPYIITARPMVVFESRAYPSVVRIGSPWRHPGHFRHG